MTPCPRKTTAAFIPMLILLASCALHAQVNPNQYQALRWRSIGPYRGGRSTAVAGDTSNRLVFYMGATGGGVWKTADGGISWTPVSDGYFKTGSVGTIAVSVSDPNTIYVGMGGVAFALTFLIATVFTSQPTVERLLEECRSTRHQPDWQASH